MRNHDAGQTHRGVDVLETAQRFAEAGRQAAARAATYVRESADRASEYAQGLGGAASKTINDMTGRAPEEWTRPLRNFVEQSPVKAVVAAIAVGFVVGRMIRHG